MIADYFIEVEDIREQWKVKHSVLEIIVMVITAVAGGCDAWEVIEDFCKVKKEWLKTRLHLKLENGIPSHDTMQRVFGMIKPKEFEKSFCSWIEQRGKWCNLNGIGMVESKVTHTDSGLVTEDRRFLSRH